MVPPSPTGSYCIALGLAVVGPSSFASPAIEAPARLPLAFVENAGQWSVPSRFVARRGDLRTHLSGDSFTLQVLGEEDGEMLLQNVRFEFEGADASAIPAGLRELPGRHHFFLGADPARWRTDVRSFAEVLQTGLYEGIDLLWREERGRLEYDLRLAPGSDLSQVVVRVEGASGALRIEDDGTLVVRTERGELRQAPPRTWEEVAGRRRPVEARYRRIGEDRFGFEAPSRDPLLALVVDPGLTYSTYLGGSGDDTPWGIALDPTGVAVVVGRTYSVDFPTTPGVFGPIYSGLDFNAEAFVSRISAAGDVLLSSTFLGGTNGDAAEAVVLDPAGVLWISGRTRSTDFPVTPGALDTTYNGGIIDGFVTCVSATGDTILYSTYLGGSATDQASSIVTDVTGAVTVAGRTDSDDFPTTPGAYDTTFNGHADIWAARFLPSGGTLLFSTYLGGSLDDGPTPILHGPRLDLDLALGIFLAGTTGSPDFPTTPGAFDTTLDGPPDAFVARLDLAGTQLLSSTYLGGSGIEELFGMQILPTGAATLAGSTESGDFPATPGAYDQTYNGGNGGFIGDGFVARFNLAMTNLTFATFLGGALDDRIVAFGLDPMGASTVGGRTDSIDFPVTAGAYDIDFAGPSDAFLARVGPLGSALYYSTFMGDSPAGEVWAIALDPATGVAASGWTLSPTFPTTPNVLDPTYNGSFDVWVTRLDLLPTGAARYGEGTRGCLGPLVIGVNSMPEVGNGSFGITCGNASPFTSGLFLLGAAPLSAPLTIADVNVWVNPAGPFLFLLYAAANEIGAAERALPIPLDPSLQGGQVFAQFLFIDLCASSALAASEAIAISIQ